MKVVTHLFLICLFVGSCLSKTQAQSIEISNVPYSICLGSPIKLNYKSTFNYSADNRFYVEVSQSPYEESKSKTFQATAQNGAVSVTIPVGTVPMSIYDNRTNIRIVTTNPVSRTIWYPINAYQTPEVLLQSQKLTLDINDPINLKFSVTGKPPVSLVLKDTLTGDMFPYKLNSNTLSIQQFEQDISIAADRSRAYVVQSAQNECGNGKGQGKVEVAVNALSIKLISFSPAVVCPGSSILASYQIANGSLGQTNTFRVELYETNIYDTPRGQAVITLPAQNETNGIRFTIPADLPANYYTIRILTSDPVSGSVRSNYFSPFFSVSSAPSAKLISPSQTINYGDTAPITIQFAGIKPFVASLQDGTVVKSDSYNDQGSVFLRPQQTTSYTVKNFYHGCGPADAGISSTLITVRKGIQSDSIPQKVFCEGSVINIPIHSNFDPAGTVSIRLFNDSNGYLTEYTVSGEIKNNVLTFKAPNIPEKAYGRKMNLEVTGKEFKSVLIGSVKIGRQPSIKVFNEYYETVTVQDPSITVLNYYAFGYGPYALTFDDGTTYKTQNADEGSQWIEIPIYALSSKEYRVTSISNSCGTSTVNVPIKVVVENPAQVGIDMLTWAGFSTINACSNKPYDLSFQTKGTFGANNRFKIVYSYDYGQNVKVLKEVSSAGNHQISFESVPGFSSGYLYIESTDPVIRSNQTYFSLEPPLKKLELTWEPENKTIIKGESLKIHPNFFSSRFTNYLIWSDGKKETRSNVDYYGDFKISPESSMTFTVKSIGNQCGSINIDSISVPITVNNARILFAPEVFRFMCKDVPVVLPYAIEGIADPNATFDVQYTSSNGKEYVDIAKNLKGNPLKFTWPESLSSNPSGENYIRIISTANKIVSELVPVYVSDRPKATVSAMDGLDHLNYPNDKTLKVTLTGESPWFVTWNDGLADKYTYEISSRYLDISRGNTYSIRSVYNRCGYGTTSGQVVVKVAPVLTLQNSSNNVCGGNRVQVSYTSSGDYANGNYFRLVLINSQEKIIARLDSSSQANYQFSSVIPSSIAPGSYQIEVQSSDNQQKIRSYLYVRNTPQITLGSNVSVPVGTAAVIRLRNVFPGTYSSETIQYTLSDGSKGSMPEYLQYQDLTFTPTQTTTYRVTSVANSCGIGTATGSATITVESPSDKETQITQVQTAGKFTGLCAGDTIFVTFTTKGSVSTNASYRVQLSDTTGSNFNPLTTGGSLPRLWALIPANLARSEYYRLKVTSSESGVNSRTYTVPLSLKNPATASFFKESMLISPDNSEPVVIQLGGDGPWQYQIGNEINPFRTITAYSNPTLSYGYSGTPTDKPAVYKLYSVSNVCGLGKILNPSILKVEIITSVEPEKAALIKVYPNPTKNWVRVECASPHKLRVINLQGNVLMENDSQELYHQLDLSTLSGGTYLLEITTKDQRNVYRIVKE